MYSEIVSGNPVAVKVQGSRSSHHYVAVVGVENVTAAGKLSASNFLIIDPCAPQFALENMGSVGYDLKFEENNYQVEYDTTSASVYFSTLTFAPPEITGTTPDLQVNAGETAGFVVDASGPNLSYQWYYRTDSASDGYSITSGTFTGFNTAVLSFPSTSEMNCWQFRCAVSNSAGTVYSPWKTLLVESPDHGTWGNLSWTLGNNGLLTISGNGEMDDFSTLESGQEETRAWRPYLNEIRTIVIDNGVTSISSNAFRNCVNLSNVSIPSSVETIGSRAFFGCSNLTNVTLPVGLKSLSSAAFYRCSSLTSIIIPSGVNGISDAVFHDCNSLTSVSIPTSVIWIRASAFEGCSSLTDVYYNGTQEQWNAISISSYNEPLTGATIHYNFTSIVNSGIWGALTWTLDSNGLLTISGNGEMNILSSAITSNDAWHTYKNDIKYVIIKNGVKNISPFAFYYCVSLEGIQIAPSVQSIGESAFSGCSSLTAVSIPNGIESIQARTFYECSRLENVDIPSSVKRIESSAFYCCTQLRNLVLPSDLSSISNYVFYGCSSLQTITIPASLKSIDYRSFSLCSNLQDVYYLGSQSQWNEIAIGSDNVPLTAAAIHYNFQPDFILPMSLKTIDDEAFVGGAFTFVVLMPDTMTIGWHAFANCPNLQYIFIPPDTHYIDPDAFDGVSALTILGTSGSYAHNYAQQRGFAFIPID